MIKTENNSAKYIYAYIAILKNMIIVRRKKNQTSRSVENSQMRTRIEIQKGAQ